MGRHQYQATCMGNNLDLVPRSGRIVNRTNARVAQSFQFFCSSCWNVFFFQAHLFVNAKCAKSFCYKRNPRKVCWTVLYRRKHKKGLTEAVTKKRTRRTTKFQRAITGATLTDIMAKRNQKPEVRKAQREQAIRWIIMYNSLVEVLGKA